MEIKTENTDKHIAKEERRKLRKEFRHNYRNRGIGGGLFLIFLGTIFLLNNLGIVPWIIWNYVIGFWPLLLILVGIKTILGNNIFSRILTDVLFVAVLVMVLIYGLSQVNSPLINSLDPQLINFVNILDNLRR